MEKGVCVRFSRFGHGANRCVRIEWRGCGTDFVQHARLEQLSFLGPMHPSAMWNHFRRPSPPPSLVPQSGGQLVPLITSTAPATVDFARLADFTNILNTASVTPGTYNQLQMTLTNPQLIVLNTSTSPPTPQTIAATLTTTSLHDYHQSGPGDCKSTPPAGSCLTLT